MEERRGMGVDLRVESEGEEGRSEGNEGEIEEKGTR